MAICPGITETPMVVHSLEGRDTFDYVRPLSEAYLAPKQTAKACGQNFVKAVEQWKNGGLWICDRGTLELAAPKTFWTP